MWRKMTHTLLVGMKKGRATVENSMEIPQKKKKKNLPAMQETQVWSLCRKDALEKEMTMQSSIPAWRIPWTEAPDGLQSIGSQIVGHDWSNLACSTIWSINPSYGYIPQRNEIIPSKRLSAFLCSKQHCSQEPRNGNNLMSTNVWMDNEYIYIPVIKKEILLFATM